MAAGDQKGQSRGRSMSPKFRHPTEAPKIPAHLQCPCVSEDMKMSPEDHSVPLGPESQPGADCTSATGLRRRRGEDDTSHSGTSARRQESGGLPCSERAATRGTYCSPFCTERQGLQADNARVCGDLHCRVKRPSSSELLG